MKYQQKIRSPKEALVGGLRKAKIDLPPHRFWWYHELLRTTLLRLGKEDLFILICVLVVAHEEINNEQISDEKVEEITDEYGGRHSCPKREPSFLPIVIKAFSSLFVQKEMWYATSSWVGAYLPFTTYRNVS